MDMNTAIGKHILDLSAWQTGTLVSITIWAIGHAEAQYIIDETHTLAETDFRLIANIESGSPEPIILSEDDTLLIENLGRRTLHPDSGRAIAYRVKGVRNHSNEYVIRVNTADGPWLEYIDVKNVVLDDE